MSTSVEVVGDRAARREAELARRHGLEHPGRRRTVRAPRLRSVRGLTRKLRWLPMKSMTVSSCLPSIDAQAAAELLEEHDRRLGRAQHQHRVDLGHVEALVEQVDGEDDVELAVAQLFDRLLPRRGRRPAVDRDGPRRPLAVKKSAMKSAWRDRDSRTPACGSGPVARPFVERLLGPLRSSRPPGSGPRGRTGRCARGWA